MIFLSKVKLLPVFIINFIKRAVLITRNEGSIIKMGAHRLRGTLAGFLEVRLSTFSGR